MRTPVVLVTGIDPDALAATLVGLAWDLPDAVAVRHEIDPHLQVLTRTVSDATGVLEHEQIQLEHACTSCALREDIVPTLERLARDGRWRAVVACLPTGAEAVQVDNVIAWDTRLQRHLRIVSVVTALAGGSAVDDLLGDALLRERGWHSGPDDARGTGEVGCSMVEYADTVVLVDGAERTAQELVTALAGPRAQLVLGSEHLDAAGLLAGRHDHAAAFDWTSPVSPGPLPPYASGHAWRLELTSPRPFHPQRLLDGIDRLGGGRHRSRGCFWLPTRPGRLQEWDGAGGQLSIGAGDPWGRRTPRTRLVLTGVGAQPHGLREAFEELLLAPGESVGPDHLGVEDGLEPWLGPVRDIA
jgi:G3E family GTPase